MSVYAFLKNLYWRMCPGTMPENDRIFRKSSVSDQQIEFWRPCRGRSPGKGFASNKATHYMTRRAFLGLRVIQRQGNRVSTCLSKIGVNGLQKCRFLKISELVSLLSNFPLSMRSRPIQECRSQVHLCVLEKSVLEDVSGHDAGK